MLCALLQEWGRKSFASLECLFVGKVRLMHILVSTMVNLNLSKHGMGKYVLVHDILETPAALSRRLHAHSNMLFSSVAAQVHPQVH